MIVRDTIHIDAPPSVVWRVTRDVERWPEWSPTMTAVTRLDAGEFGLGSAARVKQPWQPEAVWVVTAFVEGRRFAWETRRPGLRMIAAHELAPAGSGTRNELSLEVRGLVGFLLWPLLRLVTRWALAQENRGLERRCEEIARGASG